MPSFVRLFVAALIAGLLVSCAAVPASTDVNAGDRRILVVMTNHDRFPSRPDRTGLWLTELTHFVDVVEKAGYTTVFISPEGGRVPLDERSLGWFYMDSAAQAHLDSPTFRERIENTLPASRIDASQYDAIYFTGGHGVMWDFPDNADLQRAAETIYADGGVVAAVCHGVAGLLNVRDSAGEPIVKGRRVTGFSNTEEWLSGLESEVPFSLEDQLVKRRARYETAWLPFMSFVLTDGRLITGQNPSSAAAVGEAVVARLADLGTEAE